LPQVLPEQILIGNSREIIAQGQEMPPPSPGLERCPHGHAMQPGTETLGLAQASCFASE
jgi:hypothetical protein